jgi:hypothetical protein
MPSLFSALLAARDKSFGPFDRRLFENAVPITSALLIGFSIGATFSLVFRDIGLPEYTVKNSQVDWVLTSYDRAQTLSRDMPAISALVPPGSTLLAFGHIPLVHFIERTRPYLSCSWPEMYEEGYLDQRLRSAETKEKLPPVLIAKRDALKRTWPSAETPFRAVPNSIKGFLERNKYSVRWSSDAFDLYFAPSTSN